MKRIYIYLFLLGLIAFSGCSTNVGVESSKHSIAVYNSFNGDFTGYISGDMAAVFRATNDALDSLDYERTAEKQRDDSCTVIARAVLDAKIRVDIERVKPDTMRVAVNFDGGNLQKSQEIFNSIARLVRSSM